MPRSFWLATPRPPRRALFSAFAVLLLAVSPLSLLSAEDPQLPPRVALWQGPAPAGDGTTDPKNAFFTVHQPARPNGAAIIICPGGGYGGLVTGAEGHGIARWLGKHGITGITLEYRLPAGRSEVPLLDAQRAIRTARAHAAEWGIRKDRIGIMGFSAGGHLAASASTLFNAGNPEATDPVARESSRPDFTLLVYPVISMGPVGHGGSRANLLGANPASALIERFSAEKQVSKLTPPAYVAHAVDDRAVPIENARLYVAALKAHQVPAHLLELPSGDHGLNGYQGPMWDAWQTGSLAWLAERGFIPAAEPTLRPVDPAVK